jgi:hypothetical protein
MDFSILGDNPASVDSDWLDFGTFVEPLAERWARQPLWDGEDYLSVR